jgi:hypothetical protein
MQDTQSSMNTHHPSLLFVADGAQLLVYTIDRSAREAQPRLVESIDFAEGHDRLGEQVSDKMGAFPTGGSAGRGNSTAERMALISELETRALRHISERIIAILRERQPQEWSLAAPAEINTAILENLPSRVRESLGDNLPRNLTHVPSDELLEHFAYARH